MKKDEIKSILTGGIVCTIVLLSSLYVLFKTGASVVIDTVLLSILVLTFMKGFKVKNVLTADIFARASISCVTTIASYFAVLFIFHQVPNMSQTVLFILVILISGCLGVLFFSTLDIIIKDEEKYAFPMLKPRVEMLKSKDNDEKQNRLLIKSISLSSIYALLVRICPFLPKTLKVNNMFMFDNSLVLIASGYFIGHQTYLKMIIGFVYSFIIYLIFRVDDFSTHILNPMIYSVILGFSIIQGVITITTMLKKMKGNQTDEMDTLFKNKKSLFYVLALLVFYLLILKLGNVKVPFWILFIIIPLSIMLSMSTLIGIAETGFWLSALEDILPIFIILLTQTTQLFPIILIVGGLTAFEFCGIYFVLNLKVANVFNYAEWKVKLVSFVSLLFSCIVMVSLMLLVFQHIGFGTSELPAPTSKVFGMTLNGLIDSLSTLQIPSYINLYVLLISCVVGYILHKRKFSPMIIVAGMMLPFGTFFVMGIGALLSYFLKEKPENNTIIFSGISVGDGIISTLITMLQSF